MIEVKQFIEKVEKLDYLTPIILKYRSDLKLNKKHRETKQLISECFAGVNIENSFKISEISGFAPFNYQKEFQKTIERKNLNPELIKVPDSKREPWHENVIMNSAVKKHKTKEEYYFYFLVNSEKKPTSAYYLNEQIETDKEQLIPFMSPTKYENVIVPVRLIKISGIIELTINNIKVI